MEEMTTNWILDGSETHEMDDRGGIQSALVLRDPQGQYIAHAYWDGYIEFKDLLLNATLHVHDIDEFIKQLQELKQLARAKFGDEWWSRADGSPYQAGDE